jgi:hypothetical protein
LGYLIGNNSHFFHSVKVDMAAIPERDRSTELVTTIYRPLAATTVRRAGWTGRGLKGELVAASMGGVEGRSAPPPDEFDEVCVWSRGGPDAEKRAATARTSAGRPPKFGRGFFV